MDDNILGAASEETSTGEYFIFSVNSLEYGVGIEYVKEIISYQIATPVPNAYPYLKGIINIRGTIVPVIDMRLKFGMEEGQYDERSCIVVLTVNGLQLGVIVDEVTEVAAILPENLIPTPQSASELQIRFVDHLARVGNTTKQLLNIDAVLNT